jgi:hypothetical protein
MKKFFALCFLAFIINIASFTGGVRAATVVFHDYERELINLTNKARIENGLLPVAYTEKLVNANRIRANELVLLFDHIRPSGNTSFSLLSELGITKSRAAENIAGGWRTPLETMACFMNSPTSKAIILDERYMLIGVGYANTSDSVWNDYWALTLVGSGSTKISKVSLNKKAIAPEPGFMIENSGIELILKFDDGSIGNIPLIPEMCSTYDPFSEDEQKVEVTYGEFHVTLTVNEKEKVVIAPKDPTAEQEPVSSSEQQSGSQLGSKENTKSVRWLTEVEVENHKTAGTESRDYGIKAKVIETLGTKGFYHDTLSDSGGVLVRVQLINPSLFIKDTLVSARCRGEDVTNLQYQFKIWFPKHNTRIISLAHKGAFSSKVHIAAKLFFDDMNRNTLLFYAFDDTSNKITQISDTEYYFDKFGYLQFNTTLGGEIIICDLALPLDQTLDK